MAAIFRELLLSWEGKEYRLKPTMAVLNRIEQYCSLSSVAHRMIQGHPPVTLLASIFADFLQAAGAPRVTQEKVYAALMEDNELIAQASQAVILAAFPNAAKKSEAPAPTSNPEENPES